MDATGPIVEQAVHGVMLVVFGTGVLVCGSSGSGKSSLALELLDRGHQLVSDDAPLLRTTPSGGQLLGRASELLHGYLQVGGLGVIDVRRLFTTSVLVNEQQLDMVIRISATAPSPSSIDPDTRRCRLLGVELPEFRLVCRPGLNRALWAEYAVRQWQLQHRGHHTGRTLAKRQTTTSAGPASCA